jgi:hypothetical protein
VGYKIFGNGAQIGTTSTTAYADSGLAASTTYSYAVSAFDAAGNNSAPSSTASATTLAVADTIPPTVSISAPSNGATVSGVITISANASDNVGVAGVQFKFDGQNIGPEIALPPYTLQVDTATTNNGSHTITATARDTSGNTTTSAPVMVTVNNGVIDTTPPTVSITQPLNGALVTRRSVVTITANASDNVGVTKVEFYISGTLLGTTNTAPYSIDWQVPAAKNKTYSIQTKAYDAAGNTSTSNIVTVTAQ